MAPHINIEKRRKATEPTQSIIKERTGEHDYITKKVTAQLGYRNQLPGQNNCQLVLRKNVDIVKDTNLGGPSQT